MKTADLVEMIHRKVREISYGDDDLLRYLNLASYHIAGWENKDPNLGYSGTSILLDALQHAWILETEPDENFVSAPDDFQKNLFLAFDENKNELNILPNIRQLYAVHGKRARAHGPVQSVTMGGGRIHYAQIPEVVTELEVHGYRKPDILVLGTPGNGEADEPYWIPEHLQVDLLISHCIMQIFNAMELEVGIDRVNPQIARYEAIFYTAMSRLNDLMAHKVVHAPVRRKIVRYF